MDSMTTAEVAKYAGIPEPSLRWFRHVGQGGPRSFKLGRRVLYLRSDVDAWLLAAINAERDEKDKLVSLDAKVGA